MSAYYNEHDRFAAAWLRELIRDGCIPAGDVDERDIQLVQPADFAGYEQCHFFAGIGGWAYALRLAGWPDDRPVWTGSCPCQPFSAAGKGAGFADSRHLWPTWFRLIRECRPPVVFGEQVASADGLAWFDTVSTDLEAEAYAVGAADLAAASVGAPHLRQRLFFVADATDERARGARQAEPSRDRAHNGVSRAHGAASRALADSDGGLPGHGGVQRGGEHGQLAEDGRARLVGQPEGHGREWRPDNGDGGRRERPPRPAGAARVMAHGNGQRRAERPEPDSGPLESGERTSRRDNPLRCRDARAVGDPDRSGEGALRGVRGGPPADRARSPWADLEWLPCSDGKARPTQPGLQPLAHGISNRVGTLRGAGNTIVPQVAAQFIGAYLEGVTT